MRALLMDRVRGPLAIRDVPDPTPPPDGVVVDVVATGLCRSDWHAWTGHEDLALPHVPGHELAGVVSAVGAGVEHWSVGDRVTVPFVCGCGRCAWCRAGDAQVCPQQEQPGFTHWGSFAERVALHAADTNLVRVPDAVSFDAAAALGCRVATAYRGLVARARVQAGEWIVVVGAGGVGLSAVMVGRALGGRVIVADRHRVALDAATRVGADHVLLAGEDDIPDAVRRLTGGEGAHVSVDAVGSAATCRDAILALRRRGRHVQIGLLPSPDGMSAVPMSRVIAWELDILGSHGMAAVDYPGMLALIEAGALRPQDLIERTVTLEEAAALLPRLDTASPAGMTMIHPAG